MRRSIDPRPYKRTPEYEKPSIPAGLLTRPQGAVRFDIEFLRE